MRRVIFGAVVLLGVAAAVRWFGPLLGRRAIAQCEAMFDHMPEDFPPKRMMNSIEETRQQNARILQHLERETEQPVLTSAH